MPRLVSLPMRLHFCHPPPVPVIPPPSEPPDCGATSPESSRRRFAELLVALDLEDPELDNPELPSFHLPRSHLTVVQSLQTAGKSSNQAYLKLEAYVKLEPYAIPPYVVMRKSS